MTSAQCLSKAMVNKLGSHYTVLGVCVLNLPLTNCHINLPVQNKPPLGHSNSNSIITGPGTGRELSISP